MKGVRLTKAEVAVIRLILSAPGNDPGLDKREQAALASVLAKLDAAEAAKPGADVGPIEDALVSSARGKVLRLEGGFGRASVMAAAVGATPETAGLVGAWLARTAYFTQPMTLIDVLNKWHQWLPKARATEPPPALKPGLGTDAPDARGPASAGQAATSGRRAPGFR